jgi:hypothetical protein
MRLAGISQLIGPLMAGRDPSRCHDLPPENRVLARGIRPNVHIHEVSPFDVAIQHSEIAALRETVAVNVAGPLHNDMASAALDVDVSV